MSTQPMPLEIHRTTLSAVTYALHAAKLNMQGAKQFADGKLQQHYVNEVTRLEEAQQYLFKMEISA